jgi:hypothetical protein
VERVIWPEIAQRELRDHQEPVERVETASTVVSPTTWPATALKEVHASVERDAVRVPEVTTATDAVNRVIWPEIAPTHKLKVLAHLVAVETASDAVNWDILPEIAQIARPPPAAEPQDKATASSAVSPVTWPETALLKQCCQWIASKKEIEFVSGMKPFISLRREFIFVSQPNPQYT